MSDYDAKTYDGCSDDESRLHKSNMSMISAAQNVIGGSPNQRDDMNRWKQRRQQYEQQLNLLSNIESVIDGSKHEDNTNNNNNNNKENELSDNTMVTSTKHVPFMATFSPPRRSHDTKMKQMKQTKQMTRRQNEYEENENIEYQTDSSLKQRDLAPMDRINRFAQQNSEVNKGKFKFLKRNEGTTMLKNRYELEKERQREKKRMSNESNETRNSRNGKKENSGIDLIDVSNVDNNQLKNKLAAINAWRLKQQKLEKLQNEKRMNKLKQKQQIAFEKATNNNKRGPFDDNLTNQFETKNNKHDRMKIEEKSQSEIINDELSCQSRFFDSGIKDKMATTTATNEIATIESNKTENVMPSSLSSTQGIKVEKNNESEQESEIGIWNQNVLPTSKIPKFEKIGTNDNKTSNFFNENEDLTEDDTIGFEKQNMQQLGKEKEIKLSNNVKTSNHYPPYSHHYHTSLFPNNYNNGNNTNNNSNNDSDHSHRQNRRLGHRNRHKQATVFTMSKRDRLANKYVERQKNSKLLEYENELKKKELYLENELKKLNEKSQECKKQKQLALDEFKKYSEMIENFENNVMYNQQKEFELYKEKELKMLNKKRSELDKKARSLLNIPNRQERDQITQLKQEMSKMEEEFNNQTQRLKADNSRLKKQIKKLKNENQDLQNEIKTLSLNSNGKNNHDNDDIASIYSQPTTKRMKNKMALKRFSHGSNDHGFHCMATRPNSSYGMSGYFGRRQSTQNVINSVNQLVCGKHRRHSNMSSASSVVSVASTASSSNASRSSKRATKMNNTTSLNRNNVNIIDHNNNNGKASMSMNSIDANMANISMARPRTMQSMSFMQHSNRHMMNNNNSNLNETSNVLYANNGHLMNLVNGSNWQAQQQFNEMKMKNNNESNTSSEEEDNEDNEDSDETDDSEESDNDNHNESCHNENGNGNGKINASEEEEEEEDNNNNNNNNNSTTTKKGQNCLPAMPIEFEHNYFTQSQSNSQVLKNRRNALHKLQYPDGKIEQIYTDGSKLIIFPNGTEKIIFANRTNNNNNDNKSKEIFVKFPNKDVKKVLSDGREVYFYASNDITHVTQQDGIQLFYFKNQQHETHFPDGSKHIVFADATKKFIHSNGQEECIYP